MIKRKSGRLSYFTAQRSWREDLPTLVFLHSSGLNAKMWHKQVEGLQDVANTVALDLPGHGGSDGNGLDSMPAYAAVVADFVREIKAPGRSPAV